MNEKIVWKPRWVWPSGGLGVAVIALASLLVVPVEAQLISAEQMASIERVTAEQLLAARAGGEVTVIDTRSLKEYARGHIAGALQITDVNIEVGAADLPREVPVVTYCECPREIASARAGVLLREMGFTRVATLTGGLAGWEAAGGEVAAGAPEDPVPADGGGAEKGR